MTGYFKAGDDGRLIRIIDSNSQVAIQREGPDLVRIVASGE